jgi:hypothetical protein
MGRAALLRFLVFVGGAVRFAAPSSKASAFASIACADGDDDWCIVADGHRDQLLSVGLGGGAVRSVWGRPAAHGARIDGDVWVARFDGPACVALVRGGSAVLVGERNALRSADARSSRVSTLAIGLCGGGAPVDLAVDERGSAVRGRKGGTLVAYALCENGDAHSVDVAADGAVADARLALHGGDYLAAGAAASGLAFDAARGELLIAAGSALYASASRVLGEARRAAAAPGSTAGILVCGHASS